MIDKLHFIPQNVQDWKELLPVLQKILEHIHEKGTQIAFANTTCVSIGATNSSVAGDTSSSIDCPIGKILVVDDGTTKQVFLRTDKNHLLRLHSDN